MKRDLEVWLGEPYPLGATLTEEGVNFALYSEDATAVELYGLRTGSAMLMQATLESKKKPGWSMKTVASSEHREEG